MIRCTARVLLPRGRFSSMLELGGSSVPGSKSTKQVDVGKNSKIRACMLDFNLITRAIEATRSEAAVGRKAPSPVGGSSIGSAPIEPSSKIRPDVGIVENMAGLLNVDLGGQMGRKKHEAEDDLSSLTGEGGRPGGTGGGSTQTNASSKTDQDMDGKNEIGASILSVLKRKMGGSDANEAKSSGVASDLPHSTDVRAKYARKLRAKLDGGLAGVERAKSERGELLKKGDAAGHLAARKIASANPPTSGSRWLATTGAGNLLTFLTGRSMRIALLPLPNPGGCNQGAGETEEGQKMEELTRQLPQARFDVLVKDGQGLSSDNILEHASEELSIPSIGILVVSDRDDYLRSAKEQGMYTCRVRPKNAPRGNVTTSYSVATVGEVQDVVNEMNGISFNEVFGSAGINHGGV